jgi:peroxiredoxin/outer membrane lipoprotein-sorting protein
MKSLFCALTFSLAVMSPVVFAEPPATQPAARKLEAKVSSDARKTLDEITSAYGALTSLELSATTTFDGDISGKKDHEIDTMTGAFVTPNKFRHEMKGNMIAGSTGEKAYVFSVEENTFIQKDAPKERVAAGDAPRAMWDVLVLQNPSLAMALAKDAGNQLIDGATAFALVYSKELPASDVEKGTEIKKVDDVKLGDKSFTALKLINAGGEFTYLIDPQSHLLRQVSIDQTSFFKHIGQPDVKKAMTTVDYTTIASGAKVADDKFAWVPPAGARELTAMAKDDAGEEAAMALVGKPAPDFKLKDLKKNDVSLADQKGSVVIVDFWATWCGPCVESLPRLNKLYEDKKAAGLKVFAVSVDEDKEKVPLFVEDKKLTLTVLLDNDEQKVSEKYGVQGIPQTVIIGKDGVVKKVFVGFGPGSEEEMRKVVEDAMK